MTHVECITPIVQLNSKLQCLRQVPVIIVMYTYFIQELYQEKGSNT